MKYIVSFIFAIASVGAYASTAPDLSKVTVKPNTLSMQSYDSYDANSQSNFKGRNSNVAGSSTATPVANRAGISKTVHSNSNKTNAAFDNLESTAGEFISKVEDDRKRQSEKDRTEFYDVKNNLVNAYDRSKNIDINNLGEEQDPYVQRAFKCANIKNCKPKSESDPHAIKECSVTQRLFWSGVDWQCVDLLKPNPGPECDKDSQWSTQHNNGVACVDYIYLWDKTGTSACKPDGTASIIYSCMKKKNKTDKGIAVSSSFCLAKQPSGTTSCTYYSSWTTGLWSTCSKTCGGGTKTRTVTCSTANCKGPKPSSSESCNTQACSGSWQTGEWGACSKSCGTGVQSRTVTCPSGFVCTGDRPVADRICNTHACSGSWQVGSWSTCSKSCGGGTQTRSVTCPDGYNCTGTKPSTSQACNTQACTASWQVGSWSTCSKTCGGGTKTRSVTCPSGFTCTGSKPSTSTSCNTQACITYSWYTGSWSACSSKCGTGRQTRDVYCKGSNGSVSSDSNCTGSKPSSSVSCKGDGYKYECGWGEGGR